MNMVNFLHRILLIGAGSMAAVHNDCYKIMENVKVIGVIDATPQGQEFARRNNIKHYTDFDMVPVEDYDIVDICSLTDTHLQYVKKAASAGKDIFCEKPLARNMEQAGEILKVCNEAHVRISVGQVVRFFPAYVRAKQVVDSGEIGDVVRVQTTRGGQFPVGWNDWYANIKSSGGTMVDLVIHDFDFLRWLLGDVESVQCTRKFSSNPSKDYSITTLRFTNGVIADCHGMWIDGKFRTSFQIAGTQGVLLHDSLKERQVTLTSSIPLSFEEVKTEKETTDPYFLELQSFIKHLETGEKFVVDGKEAYESLKISLAAEKSSLTGERILLEVKE